jgi:hypothetical protein
MFGGIGVLEILIIAAVLLVTLGAIGLIVFVAVKAAQKSG